ncbi:Probable aspartic protease At2g35615 [Linum perenne]
MTPTTLFLHFGFIFLFSSLSLITSNDLTITTRLIHRDSLLSSLETFAGRAARSLKSSTARHAYISSVRLNRQHGANIGLVEAINHNIFYVNFSIGNPPIPQLAVMDTIGDLLWVKCLPCSPCSSTSGMTFFDPTKSKTFIPRQFEDDVFCFAFLRSPKVSFIGLMAQQRYNIGYDLKNRRLHFQEIDCEILGYEHNMI